MSTETEINICENCHYTIPENEIPVFYDGDGWHQPRQEFEYCPKCSAIDPFYEIESYKQYKQNQELKK